MREDPAPEEGAELALDEAGQPHPVGARGGRGEEGLQVLPDHSVQDRVGGSAWDVRSHGARPSGFRAVATARPQDARTISTGEFKTSQRNTRRNRALRRSLTRTRCGGGVDRFAASGRGSPLMAFSKPRDAQSHTRCVVPCRALDAAA